MKLAALIFFLCIAHVAALAEGELQFTLNGKKYSTQNAQAIVESKRGKTRIHIAVKDVTEKFMLYVSAEIQPGDELKPLQLTTEDSTLTVSLRTKQGTFAVMPHIQLAPVTDLTYSEQVQVETSEMEDDPHATPHEHTGARKKRKKIRTEYRRVKPKWHTMSKADRIKHGEGIIENGAFRDSLFLLKLQPVVAGGKLVSLDGTFGGTGRLARGMSGDIKPIQNGNFRVKVTYVP